MVIRLGLLDGIPAEVMLVDRQIAALIEVGADVLAGLGGERREEPADKGEGDAVGDLPAVFRLEDLRGKYRSLREQADQIVAVTAEAQIKAAGGGKLNVEVAVVSLHRAEEEFQAAVLAGRTERSLLFGTDLRFHGAEADVQGGIVVAELGLGGDVRLGAPELVSMARVGTFSQETGREARMAV